MSPWFQLANPHEVASPALLFYRDRIERNLDQMVALVGDARRLRPHMKTHKCGELIRRQLARGITKFKCATIAEAELAASCGAAEVLLACPLVGPNIDRFLQLAARFASARFQCIADNAGSLAALSAAAARVSARVEALLDLDLGQHRTGVAPDDRAVELYRRLCALPALTPGGLHAYDGQVQDTDRSARARRWEEAFAPVEQLRGRLQREGLPAPRVVAGGTPTFPFHAQRTDVECSPGTCVLWDAGYARNLPDMNFVPAALLLTRVISKPTPNRLCLDLGHKAVASEMPPPRVVFLNLPDATPVAHNEEHLVVETPRAADFAVGDCVYGVPWHVCPTVALHAEAVVVEAGTATARWPIEARARRLTI